MMQKYIKKKEYILSKSKLIEKITQIASEYANEYKDLVTSDINESVINDFIDFICNLEEEKEEVCWDYAKYNIPKSINKFIDDYQMYDINFFRYEDKYIYFYWNRSRSNHENDKYMVEIIDYILKHVPNLDLYKNSLLNHKKYFKDSLKAYDENQKTPKEQFAEYDYIKIFCNSDNIDINAIRKCTTFINNYQNKKLDLNVDEEVFLNLILLYGFKNMYFKDSQLEKEKKSLYNDILENIMFIINKIEEKKEKVSNRLIYSVNCDNRINLWRFLNVKTSESYAILRVFNNNGYSKLIEICLYIYFEHNINKHDYKKAKEILDNHYLPLFGVLDRILTTENHFYNDAVSGFKYYLKKDLESNAQDLDIDNLDSNIKIKLRPIINYMISYYKYLKYFNKNEMADKLYSILLLFKNNYNIEDFIKLCEYEKTIEKITELKIDSDNQEDIDLAINKMHEMLTKNFLVEEFDINKVVNIYKTINFNKLDPKVKKYIATGHQIYNLFYDIEDFDFSSVIIEWCKAVELEMNNKLISKIKKYKKEIEEYSRKRNPNKKKPFELPSDDKATIGIFTAIKNYRLQDYLYDYYYSNIYTFNKQTYNDLCNYMIEILNPRNNSAHKSSAMNFRTANECKEKILLANGILEILSNLNLRDN